MALEQVLRGRRRPIFATPSRRRRMRVAIVVGLFLGFVALAWAWAFQRGPSTAGSEIPVLAADPQPTREKPADPGGMKVADIDPLAYDSGRSPPRVENILPAPETPLPQPGAVTQAAAAPLPPAPAPTAAPIAATDAPPAQPVQAAQADTVAPMKQVVEAPRSAPPSSNPAVTVVQTPAAAPPPKPRPVVAREEAKPKPMAVAPGDYRLQLASLRSAADARATEERLRRLYGDMLGAVNFSVVSVNLGERGTYYRVMAGPMSQGSASQLCDSLRQRGAACLLARP